MQRKTDVKTFKKSLKKSWGHGEGAGTRAGPVYDFLCLLNIGLLFGRLFYLAPGLNRKFTNVEFDRAPIGYICL